MTCEQAQKVYVGAATPQNFVSNVETPFAGSTRALQEQVELFLGGQTTAFHRVVQKESGVEKPFLAFQLPDKDLSHKLHTVLSDLAGPMILSEYFSKMFETDLKVGAVSNDTWIVYRELSDDAIVSIGVAVGGATDEQVFVTETQNISPGVIEFLVEQARNFINKVKTPFDDKVRELSGVKGRFFAAHMEATNPLTETVHEVLSNLPALIHLKRHLSNQFGQNIEVGAVCCDTCPVFNGLDAKEVIAIQYSAIKVDAEGNTFS